MRVNVVRSGHCGSISQFVRGVLHGLLHRSRPWTPFFRQEFESRAGSAPGAKILSREELASDALESLVEVNGRHLGKQGFAVAPARGPEKADQAWMVRLHMALLA